MNGNQYATWRISPEVRTTYSEDGAVLLDINKGLCYSLNSVAARICQLSQARYQGKGRVPTRKSNE